MYSVSPTAPSDDQPSARIIWLCIGMSTHPFRVDSVSGGGHIHTVFEKVKFLTTRGYTRQFENCCGKVLPAQSQEFDGRRLR